ncbi:redox-sensing transcriptional repressor Rex [Gelria sp. Kuro-4]|uniref:redox-sensing transcriptional repressor Rex n=1 Tax=Gelria sp. Kuro-4 TaxID=2796927 RepID=UPI001BEF2269|nr:redox-sensing transcriptional repressor Rex [Gelria sp. Kuro-4]MDI3522061.1 redox-sensing transcriptional repressor [Bacillota bacterium]MDK2927587.1 redox-sensing transcriptional repressor [Bacillota bacterium]BCV23369.1 redox-sensing transcriptional repressor Rex [Gelria sp. Kuro-4]
MREGKEEHVPMVVIRRLPKYYRYLGELVERKVERISSQTLADMMGISASQLRQDLNHFGEFGQQGYGYRVEDLYQEIGRIIGLEKEYNMVIVGAGNLGQALANYPNFSKRGFILRGVFDVNPKLIGLRLRDNEIIDTDRLEDFIKKNDISIGIITVPKEAAQEVADRMVKAGIKAIWNFAPIDLKVPEDVILVNEHLADRLMVISFRLKELGYDE